MEEKEQSNQLVTSRNPPKLFCSMTCFKTGQERLQSGFTTIKNNQSNGGLLLSKTKKILFQVT